MSVMESGMDYECLGIEFVYYILCWDRTYDKLGVRYDRLCSHLQAKHAGSGNTAWGVDGDTGNLADMTELGVWDPLSVKVQTYKTAIEVGVLVCVPVRVHVCHMHMTMTMQHV